MNGPSSPREHLAVLTSFAPRIVRKVWVGGVAMAIGLVTTMGLALSTHRLYRSESMVAYERGIRTNSFAGEGESPRIVGSRLRDMIQSRQRLEGLINQMHLYPAIMDKRGLVEAIDEMRKHLTITDREGYTYRVSYDSDARDLAQNVLTRMLASVVEDDKQRRARDAEETTRFLAAERRHADEDLKAKESALSTFLTSHPQLAAEVGGGAASTGGLIRAADRDRAGAPIADVAGLELQAAQLEESLQAAGAASSTRGAASSVAPDPLLVAARGRAEAELQAAQRDLAEKQTHLTNEHPDVKQALRRVTVAEAAERRAAAAVAAWKPPASTEAPAAEAGESGRVAALRRALASVRQQIAMVRGRAAPRVEVPKAVSSVVAIDTQWTALNRDVSEARERQSQLESKQFQAELAATLATGGQGGQFVIADPPFRPMRPIAGGRFKIAAVGTAGSFLLAVLMIGLFAAFDDRLYAGRDVEGILEDGIVVVIPGTPRKIAAKGG